MGLVTSRAIERAGLADVAARALAGGGLDAADLARVRDADLLVLAGLADAVRARHRGDVVRVAPGASRLEGAVHAEPDVGEHALTGAEALREVALLRLATPARLGVSVSWTKLGVELALAALAFGADALVGGLTTKAGLPLADAPAVARRDELTRMIALAGRTAQWTEARTRPEREEATR